MVMTSSSWAALFRGQRAVHTLLLVLGIGVHAISVHMLITVLPSVVADIGGAAFYAWAMMLYTIASIVGTACGGVVKAAWGIRRGYVLGGLMVLAGAVGCALAPRFVLFLCRGESGRIRLDCQRTELLESVLGIFIGTMLHWPHDLPTISS